MANLVLNDSRFLCTHSFMSWFIIMIRPFIKVKYNDLHTHTHIYNHQQLVCSYDFQLIQIEF